MPKSVLGNDPFKTAANPSQRADEKKKATSKKAKKGSRPRAESRRDATAEAPEKAAGEKATRTPAKKAATKKAPAKKAATTKSTPKKSAVKKNPAKKAPTAKAPTTSEDKPKAETTPKINLRESTLNVDETTPDTAQSSRVNGAGNAGLPLPIDPDELSVPVSPLAVGGGDPALLPLMRPDDFSLGQEYGVDPGFRESISPVLKFFYRYYWRVTVKGIENLPKDGRSVLVCNHAGILPFDALMLGQAVRREAAREVWPLIEDFFYHAPVLGPMLSRAGCVRACQENAQRLLAEKQLVAVFPEGIKGIVKSYRKRYRLQRFGRGGFVKLCLQTDSPAVPVAIVGSEEAHPMMANFGSLAKLFDLPFFPVTPLFPLLGPLGLLPLPSKWTIVIGEPLYINQFGPEAAGDRVAINRLSNQVKNHIQKMIDMELGVRHSRWR